MAGTADTTERASNPLPRKVMEALLTYWVESLLCAWISQCYSDITCPWSSAQLITAEELLYAYPTPLTRNIIVTKGDSCPIASSAATTLRPTASSVKSTSQTTAKKSRPKSRRKLSSSEKPAI
jgi:hypothetical protein